ncbi:DUF1289 domain-containing protein [Ramlibacter tataouinensis]|uniref:DUF1289 domain-containing protein n=1 Tax=Ramlibacter tataouinensis TaxID=94132 RepID=UPI000777544B|nr:DUF1289 domain-containing protein [Ramlibacter tataouinensis]
MALLAERARELTAGAAQGVPSPCMSVCRMDLGTGWCEGCLRTLDEIAAWSRMDDREKQQVWALIGKRIAHGPTGDEEQDR